MPYTPSTVDVDTYADGYVSSYAPLVTGTDLAERLGLPATTADLDRVALAASDLVYAYVSEEYRDPAPVALVTAAVGLAVDLWQNETSAGGQPVGLDFTPGVFRAGRSLIARYSGLLAPYMSTGSLVG